MTKILIAVFLGGGTGSLLRYCVQMALHERIVPYSFPWATFAVNITGSFLIGLFATYTLLSILLGIFAALGGSIVGRTF